LAQQQAQARNQQAAQQQQMRAQIIQQQTNLNQQRQAPAPHVMPQPQPMPQPMPQPVFNVAQPAQPQAPPQPQTGSGIQGLQMAPQPVMTAPVPQPQPMPQPGPQPMPQPMPQPVQQPSIGDIRDTWEFQNHPELFQPHAGQLINQQPQPQPGPGTAPVPQPRPYQDPVQVLDQIYPTWGPNGPFGPGVASTQPVQQPPAQPGQTVLSWPGGSDPGPGGIMALAPH
jgi:hypothetical protein